MAHIEVYTSSHCPYCDKAKMLLKHKGVTWDEIRVDQDAEAKELMLARAEGRRTVPQIFINGKGIGGCDDLYALEQSGELDALLAAQSS